MLSLIVAVAVRISMTIKRNSSIVKIERAEDLCDRGGVCVRTKPDQVDFYQEELTSVDVQRINCKKINVNHIDWRQDDEMQIKPNINGLNQLNVKRINADEREGRKFCLQAENFILINMRKTDNTNYRFHINNGVSDGLGGIYIYGFSIVINGGLYSFTNSISISIGKTDDTDCRFHVNNGVSDCLSGTNDCSFSIVISYRLYSSISIFIFRVILIGAIEASVEISIFINNKSRSIDNWTNTGAGSNSNIIVDDIYDDKQIVADKWETKNERHEMLHRITQPKQQETYCDHEGSRVSLELPLRDEIISAKLIKKELNLTFWIRVDMKATHDVVNQKLTTGIKKDGLKYLRSISSSHNQSMIIQDTKISSVKQSLGQRRKKSKNSAKDIGDAVQIEGEHKNDEVVDEGVGDKSDEDIIDIDRNREMMEDVMSDVLVTKITEITITMEALIDTFVIGLVGENTHIVIMMEGTRRDYSITKMIDPG